MLSLRRSNFIIILLRWTGNLQSRKVQHFPGFDLHLEE